MLHRPLSYLGPCAAVSTAARARRPLHKAKSRFGKVTPRPTDGKEGTAHGPDRRMDAEERKMLDDNDIFEMDIIRSCNDPQWLH